MPGNNFWKLKFGDQIQSVKLRDFFVGQKHYFGSLAGVGCWAVQGVRQLRQLVAAPEPQRGEPGGTRGGTRWGTRGSPGGRRSRRSAGGARQVAPAPGAPSHGRAGAPVRKLPPPAAAAGSRAGDPAGAGAWARPGEEGGATPPPPAWRSPSPQSHCQSSDTSESSQPTPLTPPTPPTPHSIQQPL